MQLRYQSRTGAESGKSADIRGHEREQVVALRLI